VQEYLEAEPSEEVEERVRDEVKRLERADALSLRKPAQQNPGSYESVVNAAIHRRRNQERMTIEALKSSKKEGKRFLANTLN